MRVVCIEDAHQFRSDAPHVKKGNIYTVVEEEDEKNLSAFEGFAVTPGTHYVLLECGIEYAYHQSMFLKINEDQQDETEFERAKVKQCSLK